MSRMDRYKNIHKKAKPLKDDSSSIFRRERKKKSMLNKMMLHVSIKIIRNLPTGLMRKRRYISGNQHPTPIKKQLNKRSLLLRKKASSTVTKG